MQRMGGMIIGGMLGLTAVAGAQDPASGVVTTVAGFDPVVAAPVLEFLTNPVVALLLLVLAMVGLIFEIKAGAFGLGGPVSLTSLGLFFGSSFLLGLAGWEEVILLGRRPHRAGDRGLRAARLRGGRRARADRSSSRPSTCSPWSAPRPGRATSRRRWPSSAPACRHRGGRLRLAPAPAEQRSASPDCFLTRAVRTRRRATSPRRRGPTWSDRSGSPSPISVRRARPQIGARATRRGHRGRVRLAGPRSRVVAARGTGTSCGGLQSPTLLFHTTSTPVDQRCSVWAWCWRWLFIALIVLIDLLPVHPDRALDPALLSGVRVSFFTLFGMRFRKVDPTAIVDPLITAHKAGLAARRQRARGPLPVRRQRRSGWSTR